MNHVTQFRQTYLAAAPHTFYTATYWIASGLIAEFYPKRTAIVVFIVSATFTFPAGELIRKLMNPPQLLSPDNNLGKMFMLSAFGIPLCYPLIYFACKGNLQLFFPAFSILIGAHYLIFIYGYGLITFGILSLLMVIQGTYLGLYPPGFSASAYVTAFLLACFGLFHYFLVKREIRSAGGQ